MVSSSSPNSSFAPSSTDRCLNRLLFPMRVKNPPSSIHLATANNNTTKGTTSSSSSSIPNGDDNADVEWIGLDPLEMVEKLALMAEQSMILSETNTNKLHKQNNNKAKKRRSSSTTSNASVLRSELSYLASKTPELEITTAQETSSSVLASPSSVKTATTTNTSHGSSSSSSSSSTSVNSSRGSCSSVDDNDEPTTPITTITADSSCLSGQKRSLPSFDRNLTITVDNLPSTSTPLPHPPPPPHHLSPLPPWDPTFILTRDPQATSFVSQLISLARQFESCPSYRDCLPSYRRLRDAFVKTLDWIHVGSRETGVDPSEGKRLVLDDFYEESVRKMEALVTMAKVMDEERRRRDEPRSPGTMRRQQSCGSPGASSAGKRIKRDFADYMTHWLRENWTNPFPDDEGLAEIASFTDSNPTTVNNWLINNRTRKWRPAIIKAFELGRPAEFLREDAIRIFDGRPLRDLGQEYQQQDDGGFAVERVRSGQQQMVEHRQSGGRLMRGGGSSGEEDGGASGISEGRESRRRGVGGNGSPGGGMTTAVRVKVEDVRDDGFCSYVIT